MATLVELRAEKARRMAATQTKSTNTLDDLKAERLRRQNIAKPADAPVEEEESWTEYLLGGADAGLSILSAIPAEIAGGVTGIATSALTGGDLGAAVGVSERVREAMTYQPRTESGQEALQTVGETLAPVGEVFGAVESGLGDAVLEATGSPEMAAIAHTLPTALLELLGVGFGKGAIRTGKRLEGAEGRGKVIEAGRDYDIEALAQQVDADPAILAAADELGVDLNPAMYSNNAEFRQVVNALGEIESDSALKAQSAQIANDLSARADEVIGEAGDKSLLDANVRSEFDTTIEDLGTQSEVLYNQVNATIPSRVRVKAFNSKDYIDNTVKEMGGDIDALSSVEKDLYSVMRKKKPPTYARLDRLRKDIGQAYQGKGPFSDSLPASLHNVYAALRKDQDGIAELYGVGDTLKNADQLTQKRKGIQDQAVQLFGREMRGSMVPKITTAGKSLTKGDVSRFTEMMDAIPAARRGEAATMVLNDVFSAGKKGAQREFGRQFLEAYRGLNKNPAAKKELFKHLPPEAQRRFDAIGTVSESMEGARVKNPRGVTAEVEKAFGKGNLVQNIMGWGARLSIVKAFGLLSQGMGARAQKGVLALASRAKYADDLLASNDFNLAVKQAMKGNIGQADSILANSKAWKAWQRYLPKRQKKRLRNLGAITWLTRNPETERAQLETPQSTGIESLRLQAGAQ